MHALSEPALVPFRCPRRGRRARGYACVETPRWRWFLSFPPTPHPPWRSRELSFLPSFIPSLPAEPCVPQGDRGDTRGRQWDTPLVSAFLCFADTPGSCHRPGLRTSLSIPAHFVRPN